MIKNSKGYYQFKSFLPYSHLVHGFSTVRHGSFAKESLTQKKALADFAKDLNIQNDAIVFMDQVHDTHVRRVGSRDRGAFMPSTDGIYTNEATVFLSVRTADCVPLLLYDTKTQFVAAIHIGWKGARNNIMHATFESLVENGCNPSTLLAGIGPSIRSCCYNIDDQRVAIFSEQFPKFRDKIIEQRDNTYYLSLQQVVIEQLVSYGVLRERIEDSILCTSDHTDEFFSYRKKTSDTYGLFTGVIGLR